MFTDANNIAALVKRMESSGLIKRFQHPSDQRKKILATTPKGKSLYFRGKEIAESVEQALLDGFSSEEKDEFIRVLTKTNSYLLNESKEP
jgi:DNA-binding MarR family transcriptional regulator